MAEQKEVFSLPLTRTTKSQLTTEQLSIKKRWNLPKKILHPKTEETTTAQ